MSWAKYLDGKIQYNFFLVGLAEENIMVSATLFLVVVGRYAICIQCLVFGY